jgi:tetratricopeptide (TPR) repeat protein
MGRFEEAAAEYARLIEQHPNSEWAMRAENALGDTWSALGEWEKAVECYRNVVQRRSDSPEAIEARLSIANVKGNPFNEGRDFDAAIENYLYVLRKWDPAQRSDRERAPVYFGIGEAFRNLGRFEEAIAYYERSRGADPNGVWGAAAQNMIGNCRMALDQPEAAAQAYMQTTNFHPRQKAFASMAGNRLEVLARQGLRVRADRAAVRPKKQGGWVRILTGAVVVSGEDWEVYCSQAEWDSRERTLACRGEVRFSRQGVTLLTAEEVEVRVGREEWIVLPTPPPPGDALMRNGELLGGVNVPSTFVR